MNSVATPMYSGQHQYSGLQQQRVQIRTEKLTLSGVVLFLAGLLVASSAFSTFRPSVLGLSLHPYLIPVGVVAPFILVGQLQRFPSRSLTALTVFCLMYVFSTLGGDGTLQESFKIVSGALVIVVASVLVRSRQDFIAGAMGLSFACAIIAIRGLSTGGDAADAAMDGANKNSYSMFALPPILMAGFAILRMPQMGKLTKLVLAVASVLCLLTIFSSANRSGYLGAVVVGLLLLRDRKVQGTLLVATLTTAVAAYLLTIGDTSILRGRLERTANESDASNEERVDLFLTAMQIGLENPILGVSPQYLPFELGKRVVLPWAVADSHNVVGHVIAGSGLICFAAMIYFGFSLYFLRPAMAVSVTNPQFLEYRRLLRYMLLLWLYRGMFSREILYNPSFCLALGMCTGLCVFFESTNLPDRGKLGSVVKAPV